MSKSDSLGDAVWLVRGEAAPLLKLLDSNGEEARIVGGAVRNALLRLPVHEIDIATTALPDEVMRRVEAAGWKAVPTGIEHGTVTVLIAGKPFEVTTLRRDVETYGRKAKVVFGRDWVADAMRRDFTINALSLSADGELHDYVEGLADLAAHYEANVARGEITVLIGPPEDNDAEDLDGTLLAALKEHSVREAAALVTAATGLPRKVVYARALVLARGDR